MPFACTNSPSGQSQGFPDTCKTPVGPAQVPIPYLNIAMLSMADPGTLCPTVTVCGFAGATVQTEIPMSQGDEPGVGGGVISGSNMGSCKFKQGSSTVTFGGKAATYQNSMVGHNKDSNPNTPPGMVTAPSQSMVTVGP